jgi:21S rRNA (GM2251-2'-O)-methyltransferase
MVYPLLFGSTLLRTQQSRLSQTFRRFKSITAAIERGRQGGPDRPSRPRTTRTPTEYGGSEGGKTRRELRFDRFGPAKDGGENQDVKERPRRDRDERVSSPRSSRFGRVGSPRSRDFPSRFQGDGEDKPSKGWEERPPRTREDRPSSDRPERSSRPWEERPPRENRFASSSDRTARFEGRDRPAPRGEDREPRRERFEHREERPQRREGQFDRGERKPFDRGDRGSYNGGERKPFDRERKPFDRGDRKSFDRGDRKPLDGPRREAFGRGGVESRSEQPQGTFRRRDESSSYARERPGREQTERYQSQDSSRKQPEGAARTTETADAPRSSIRDVDSLPYTTAASEFIYGYSSVLAAMKANRRKLYNLYVHSRGASRDGLLARIRALKLFPITQEVGDEYLRAMDKASSGRPHNGVILESSALPVPPITELKPASFEDESFSVTLDSQTAEDALINGKQELYPYKAAGWRHPLILYVDGVVSYVFYSTCTC